MLSSLREHRKRWDFSQMLEIGKKLFAKIHKRKYHAHHSSEIHYLAREMEEWLPQDAHNSCMIMCCSS